MNILVLGGNGYLGSKIIRRLLEEENWRVVFTKRSSSDLSRLKPLLTESGEKLIGIPASIDAVETAMQYMDFDYVLNMACSYGRKSALYTNVIEANIDFPLKVLNCIAEKCTGGGETKKYLTIGTGLPDEFNMYSFSKKMFGQFGHYYAEHHGIDFYNLKLEMLYGSDEPRNRFIPGMIIKMLRGEEVNVTEGVQKRDIISVNDILDAVMIVIHSDLHGYQKISVGTGIAPTISELVDFIWNETGQKSIVNKGAIPMRENEPDCIGDPAKIRSLGKWEPVFWQDGIRKMINEIRDGGIE